MVVLSLFVVCIFRYVKRYTCTRSCSFGRTVAVLKCRKGRNAVKMRRNGIRDAMCNKRNRVWKYPRD
jgi:hypothetical protein